MIRAQREAHRALFCVLAVLVPLFLAAALRARPPEPPDPLEQARQELAPRGPRLVASGGGRHAVALPRDWCEPDVQVYGAPATTPGAALPLGARWLGPLARLRAWGAGEPPPGFELRPGEVALLYSLAHHEVVAALAPDDGGGR